MSCKLLTLQICFVITVVFNGCTTQSEVGPRINGNEVYNFYYPKTANDDRSGYRTWFDNTFFSSQNQSTLTDEQQTIRSALAGDSSAIHSFFNDPYREEPGEFSAVWANQVLLLLITLGDNSFTKYLSLENERTQGIVGSNLLALTMNEPKVFAKHFPETDRLIRKNLGRQSIP